MSQLSATLVRARPRFVVIDGVPGSKTTFGVIDSDRVTYRHSCRPPIKSRERLREDTVGKDTT